jgi:hypothetical protein
MDKRNNILQAACSIAACRRAMTKQADGFEWISEVPQPGGHFSSNKLEQDYQMKHPLMTTMHPVVYGGAALGAMAKVIHHNRNLASHAIPHVAEELSVLKSPAFAGAVMGGMAGMALEGLHRYHYLTRAKDQLESGNSPLDPRYSV